MSYENMKRRAKEDAGKKLTREKQTRLNSRDPKKDEPVAKPAPEVTKTLGAPAKS